MAIECMQLTFSCISILSLLFSRPLFSSLHASLIQMFGYVYTASSVHVVRGAFYDFALIFGLMGGISLGLLWIAGIYSRAKRRNKIKIPRFVLYLSVIWIADILLIIQFTPLYE